MSQPGWYPDPSGTPGRFRHWDGSSWSAQTTDNPNSSPPVGSGMPPAPTRPKGPRWPVIVGGVATVLVLVVLAVVIWRFTADDSVRPAETPSPSESASTDPQPSPSQDQGEPAAAKCANGAGAINSQQEQYTSGGLTYTGVPEWGFRFDISYWMWMDNVAAWGTILDGDFSAGIVLGGLHEDNGFVDPQQSAEATLECLKTHGPWNDQTYDWSMTGGEVTLDGMTGYELTGSVTPGPTDAYPGYDVKVVVFDAGEPGTLGAWISFAPTGDDASLALIEQAYDSLHKA